MHTITPETLAEVQAALVGTRTTLIEIIEVRGLDITETDLQIILLTGPNPVEMSGCCEGWFPLNTLEPSLEYPRSVCRACCPDHFV